MFTFTAGSISLGLQAEGLGVHRNRQKYFYSKVSTVTMICHLALGIFALGFSGDRRVTGSCIRRVAHDGVQPHPLTPVECNRHPTLKHPLLLLHESSLLAEPSLLLLWAITTGSCCLYCLVKLAWPSRKAKVDAEPEIISQDPAVSWVSFLWVTQTSAENTDTATAEQSRPAESSSPQYMHGWGAGVSQVSGSPGLSELHSASQKYDLWASS